MPLSFSLFCSLCFYFSYFFLGWLFFIFFKIVSTPPPHSYFIKKYPLQKKYPRSLKMLPFTPCMIKKTTPLHYHLIKKKNYPTSLPPHTFLTWLRSSMQLLFLYFFLGKIVFCSLLTSPYCIFFVLQFIFV